MNVISTSGEFTAPASTVKGLRFAPIPAGLTPLTACAWRGRAPLWLKRKKSVMAFYRKFGA